MAEFTPAGKNKEIRSYKGDTYSYLFRFQENGSDFDLTQLDKIESILLNKNNEVFTHVWEDSAGDTLTVSGASNHELAGTGDADTMDIAVRSYNHKVIFHFSDGSKQTYVDFDFKIINESSNQSETSHEWLIDIDASSDSASSEQLTGLYSATLQAKEDAETAESGAETAETNAETWAEGNDTDVGNLGGTHSSKGWADESQSSANAAATSATNASNSESESQDNADDAEKYAINTTSFTDSDGNTRDKGAKGYANDAETSANNAATEVQEKRVEDDAFEFNQHVIATTSIDELPPATSILPTRPYLENTNLNFTRNSGGSAFDRLGDLKDYANDEIRYNFNRDTGIYEGRYIEDQATRLNTQFSSPTTDEDVTVDNVEHTISFWGSGSVTLSGAHSETINGTDSVTRTEVQFTPSAGTLTISPSGTVEYLQLEEGSSATSPIPGDGQQKTRDPDIATVTDLSAINFNPQEGTFVVGFETNYVPSNFERVIEIHSDSQNRIILIEANGQISVQVDDGGSRQATLDLGSWTTGRNRVCFSYKKDTFKASLNGGSVVSSNSGSVPSVDGIDFGRDPNGSRYLDGFIGFATYYSRQLSDAKHQSLSTQ